VQILQEASGGLEERARDRVRVFGAPSCPIGSGKGQNNNGTTAIASIIHSFKGSALERVGKYINIYFISIYILFLSLPLSGSRARDDVYLCTQGI
jgi:hypothetical protein